MPVSKAQNIDWDQIDIALSTKKNLANLNQQLEGIKQTAIKNNHLATEARCYWYQVKIADLTTEDTCWFKNSAAIDSLINVGNSPYLKSIMLVLKAKRIAGFRDQFYNRNNKSLFVIPANTTDYRMLTGVQLDSLANSCLSQAKDMSMHLQQTALADVLWLSANPLLFLFKPDYTDIIFGEQLFVTDKSTPNKIIDSSAWLKLSPDDFISSKKLPAGIDAAYEPMVRLYAGWATHSRNNPAAFYFIESLARQYFYNHTKETDSAYAWYEKYLQQLTTSAYGTVKAHAIYQLSLRWKTLGDAYNKKINRYYYLPDYTGYFDSSKRLYYVNTLQLIEHNNGLLDSFFYLKKSLYAVKTMILDKSLHIKKRGYLPARCTH